MYTLGTLMSIDTENLPKDFSLAHYMIDSRLAVGGMGVVYKAFERNRGRCVALKVLRRDFARNEVFVRSFQEEARAVAALHHPNIVPIYYIGDEHGCPFFSMGYIEGETFDDWIERGAFFDEGAAAWFMHQAVSALEYAHQANTIHLDIKPSNFLISTSGNIFLTDFGLAERITRNENLPRDDKGGYGTPLYAAPEQFLRDKKDHRTDIYGLGATLFHLMVGVAPYPGETPVEIAKAHLYEPFPEEAALNAGISPGWVQLLKRMLSKNPENRFQDYEELSGALNELHGPVSAHVAPAEPEEVAAKPLPALFISSKGNSTGPYTPQQVEALLGSNYFSYQDQYCWEGDSRWNPLSNLFRQEVPTIPTPPRTALLPSLHVPNVCPAPPPSEEPTTVFSAPPQSAPARIATPPIVEPATLFSAPPQSAPARTALPPSEEPPCEELPGEEPLSEEPPTYFSTPSQPAPTPAPAAPAPGRSTSHLLPGDWVVSGKYQILQEIETDGREARTYLARSGTDGTTYFIKHLVEARSQKSDRKKMEELRDRLLQIQNENCLRYYDLEIGEQGILQVFEYLKGYTELRQLLKSNPDSLHNEVDRLLWQLAMGVKYLHQLGIVHRDLKPGNVMVRARDLQLKIVDYGTVSLVGEHDGAQTRFAGTLHYSPPEAQGRKVQELNDNLKKYDWWGVGRILQEVVSGCTVAQLVKQGEFDWGNMSLEEHFESILKEEKLRIYGARAGLVEYMETLLGVEGLGVYRSALRGLLTTNVAERWGSVELEKWFRNPSMPPPESYDKGSKNRSGRLFQYQGKGYTLQEIAHTLAEHEHWDEAGPLLLEGEDAVPKAKSLLEYIRRETDDRSLQRDLEEIIGLPNARKLENRDLLPAVDDFAIGLALSRISQVGGGDRLPLAIRGVPVDRRAIMLWSRSHDLADIHRVAVLTYAPLLAVMDHFEPKLHELLDPLLPILRRLQKMEFSITSTLFSPAQLATAFSVLLSPPEENKALLEKVQARYYDSIVPQLRPLLRVKEMNPDPDHVAFLLFCAIDQRQRLLSRAEYVTKEVADIKQKIDGLDEVYVLLTLKQYAGERRLFLGPLWFELLIHSALITAFYLIVMGDYFTWISPDSYDVTSYSLLYLGVPYLGVYLLVFLTVRGAVVNYLRRFAEAHLPRFWLPPEADEETIEHQAIQAGWVGQTLPEIRSQYQSFLKQYNALPKGDPPIEPLPQLPEPDDLKPFFWMAAGLIVYAGLEPGLLTCLSAFFQVGSDPQDDPRLAALFQCLGPVWVTFVPLLLLPVVITMAVQALSKIPAPKPKGLVAPYRRKGELKF